MFGPSFLLRAATPAGGMRQMSAETMPIRFVPEMLRIFRAKWYNNSEPFYRPRRLTPMERTWPVSQDGRRDPSNWSPILSKIYSTDALRELQRDIPDYFHVSYVPRPPQRIKCVSEGIVGRWYTNYWTLHSIKYQIYLASGLSWKHGDRRRAVSNFDEPFYYVDWEESKAIRDHRSIWINVHRSLAGMTERIAEVKTEQRFKHHKRTQDKFWSNRRVFLNRIKAMRAQGEEFSEQDLPVPTINFKAFDM